MDSLTFTQQLDPSDEVLCAQVASGDRIAEEMLVMRYNRLVRVCARPYFLAGGLRRVAVGQGGGGQVSRTSLAEKAFVGVCQRG